MTYDADWDLRQRQKEDGSHMVAGLLLIGAKKPEFSRVKYPSSLEGVRIAKAAKGKPE